MRANKENQQGFTLIEAIVATFLFAISVTSIINVYLSTVKINRRTDVIRTASENARYILESMSKEIANGQIDYYNAVSPCSTSISSPSDTLAIINADNDHLCFYLGDSNGIASTSGTNLWLIKNNYAAVKVNSAGVYVNNLQFYVAPTYNPYTAGSKIMPRVTITGQVKASSGSQDNVIVPIETTISIPAYDIAPQ